MHNQVLVQLMLFYGLFLITSGVVSVIFIGMKAKTALLSGGMAGTLALITSFCFSQGISGAKFAGLFISMALFIVFSWRATKTLFTLFELIANRNEDLKGKGIAFLIISLMAVVSIFVFAFQIAFYVVG